MRNSTIANFDVAQDSGAGALESLNNANLATVGGVGLAAVTAGGALFVGAAVAPGQVLGSAAVAGTLVALGAVKDEHGAYLPFFKKDEESVAPATA